MTGLVEFLGARFDEREAWARAATPGPWSVRHDDQIGEFGHYASSEVVGPEERLNSGPVDVVTGTNDSEWGYCDAVSDEDAAHIAANDPAFVLADIAAKRAIVAEWRRAQGEADRGDMSGKIAAFALGLALRHLAAPYAAHPDFDPAWRL